jgi:hypothetical protein
MWDGILREVLGEQRISEDSMKILRNQTKESAVGGTVKKPRCLRQGNGDSGHRRQEDW